jgi:hypothetical protein
MDLQIREGRSKSKGVQSKGVKAVDPRFGNVVGDQCPPIDLVSAAIPQELQRIRT